MRLRPDEVCIDELDLLQSFDIFEAQSQELRTLKLTCCPWRSLISVALSAVVQSTILLNAFCDVNLPFKTVDAGV